MGKIIVTIILVIIIIALVAVLVVGMGLFSFAAGAVGCLPAAVQPQNLSCYGVNIGSVMGGRLPQDAEHGLEYAQPAANVQRIVLDFAHENVKIVTADTATIQVQQNSDKQLAEQYQMRYGMVNGDLVVQSGMMGKWETGWPPQSMITVTVPSNLGIPVEVDTASGTVSVDGGMYRGLRVNTASGSVSVMGASGTELNVDTASGDVRMDDITCDNLDVDTVSGRMELAGTVETEAKLSSASGDINFSGVVGLLDAETVSGAIAANTDGLREFNADATSGTVRLACADVQNLRKIDVNTVSGDVRINLPENAEFNVEFDSISGDMQNEFGTAPGSKIEIDVETTSGGLDIMKH